MAPPVSTFATPLAVLPSWYTPANGWKIDSHPRLVGDVNGDSKADIVGFVNDGVYLSLSTGSGFQAPVLTIVAYGTTAGGWTWGTPRLLGM